MILRDCRIKAEEDGFLIQGLTGAAWARYTSFNLSKEPIFTVSLDNATNSFTNRRRERNGK